MNPLHSGAQVYPEGHLMFGWMWPIERLQMSNAFHGSRNLVALLWLDQIIADFEQTFWRAVEQIQFAVHNGGRCLAFAVHDIRRFQ